MRKFYIIVLTVIVVIIALSIGFIASLGIIEGINKLALLLDISSTWIALSLFIIPIIAFGWYIANKINDRL